MMEAGTLRCRLQEAVAAKTVLASPMAAHSKSTPKSKDLGVGKVTFAARLLTSCAPSLYQVR